MGRKHRCGPAASARTKSPRSQPRLVIRRMGHFDRRTLLLGTALASTLLVGILLTPTPADAVFDCIVGPPPAPASPGPIADTGINNSIVCINTEPRTNATGNAITLSTVNANHYIDLNSSGLLTATNAGVAAGTTREPAATTAPSKSSMRATSSRPAAPGLPTGLTDLPLAPTAPSTSITVAILQLQLPAELTAFGKAWLLLVRSASLTAATSPSAARGTRRSGFTP